MKITPQTTVTEYENWCLRSDTTIAQIREVAKAWKEIMDRSFDRIDTILARISNNVVAIKRRVVSARTGGNDSKACGYRTTYPDNYYPRATMASAVGEMNYLKWMGNTVYGGVEKELREEMYFCDVLKLLIKEGENEKA